MPSHLQRGRMLLAESLARYNYWLLTDSNFSDEEEFVKICERFDKKAKRMKKMTLDEIRTIDAEPSD